jgi:large subunit ribosomal protein L17
MRHQKKKKFGKGMDHRRKLLRTLASSLVLYERIETGYANARAVRPYLEKLITKAKTPTLHVRRQLISGLTRNASAKVMEVLGPKYQQRPGGYVRFTKLNDPKAGNSKVLLELVD